jgi:hypothetical protein
MSSSLSTVVSNLVRSSMGSVTSTVTDEDLDRHVAELILREAKQKAERYGKDGIRAYLHNGTLCVEFFFLFVYEKHCRRACCRPESNAPRANKRFLSSIIRSTDDHNKTILRAQALAAQEIKRAREAQEQRERRKRAEEAVAAEQLRRRRRGGSDGRWRSGDDAWDRSDGSGKRKERSWEMRGFSDDEVEEEREARKHRRAGHSRHRKANESERSSRKRRRDRSRSRSPRERSRKDGEKEGEKHSRRSRTHKEEMGSSSRPIRDGSCSPRDKLEDSDDGSEDRERRRCKKHGSHSHRTRRRSDRSVSSSRRSQSPLDTAKRRRRQSRRSHSKSPSRTVDAEKIASGRTHSPSLSETRSDNSCRERKAKRKRSPSITPNSDLVEPSRHQHQVHPDSSSSRTAMSPETSSRPPSPQPSSFSPPPSKMDKYFEKSYDPRLDVAPLTAPKVPATGLIDNAEFEGWDAMLELIRLRREDKEEKKRLERLGLGKTSKTSKNSGKSEALSVNDRWAGGGVNIMEIEYKKKGSVREWDLGKEGL